MEESLQRSKHCQKKVILVDWVFGCWRKGVILDASDLKLEGNYVVKEMELVLKLGLLCSH